MGSSKGSETAPLSQRATDISNPTFPKGPNPYTSGTELKRKNRVNKDMNFSKTKRREINLLT